MAEIFANTHMPNEPEQSVLEAIRENFRTCNKNLRALAELEVKADPDKNQLDIIGGDNSDDNGGSNDGNPDNQGSQDDTGNHRPADQNMDNLEESKGTGPAQDPAVDPHQQKRDTPAGDNNPPDVFVKPRAAAYNPKLVSKNRKHYHPDSPAKPTLINTFGTNGP